MTSLPPHKRKNKAALTVLFFILVLVSVGGYVYEFGLNKSGDALSTPEDKPSSDWEEEKAALESVIATLQKENEELKTLLDQAVPFSIEAGMDALQIAQAAEQAGIVADGHGFNEAIIRTGAKDHLSPGTYLVVPGSSHEQLIEKFTKGVIKR